jgi:hypothetical protein
MQTLNKRRIVDSFKERMKSTIVANIHDFRALSPTIAKVVVTFNTKDADQDTLREALAHVLDHRVVPIEGSFRWVHSFSLPAVVGFVRKNREIRPIEEANSKGMKALASNLLMDSVDESLWEVRSGSNGQKILVRQEMEDLSELLVTASIRQHNAPKLSSIGSDVSRGEFVSFVDPKLEISRIGYVLAVEGDNVEVMPYVSQEEQQDFDLVQDDVETDPATAPNEGEEMRGEGNKVAQRLYEMEAPVHVGQDFLTDAATLNGTDVQKTVAAPANPNVKEHMLDYYKKMFSYAPDYYEQIKQIIEGRAAM